MGMKNHEESRPGFTKNWPNEKKLFEKLASEVSMKWKNRRELKRCELTNSPGTNWEKVTPVHKSSLHKYKSGRKECFLFGSREFQDVASICCGKLSHIPSQPAVVPSPCAMLSRDQSWRPDTWNLLGTSGNVFDSPRAVIKSSSTPYQGTLHSWNQSATDGNPVRDNAEKSVAGSEERNRETTPRIARKPSAMNSFFLSSRKVTPTEWRGWSTKTSDLGASIWQIPHTVNVSMLEEKIQDPRSACSGSPSEGTLWIKEVEMVDSVDDSKSSRSMQGYHFPHFEMLDARVASALNKIIQNSYFKKKGQSGGTESSEIGSSPSRKTDRLHDLRLLLGCWRSWYRSWLRWSFHNYCS